VLQYEAENREIKRMLGFEFLNSAAVRDDSMTFVRRQLQHPIQVDLRRVEYGDERDPAMRAFLTRISPVNNAQKIRAPLFVVAGGNDPRVPRNESEQMVATVRKNGGPVWFLLGKDEGHGFAKKRNADFLFYAQVAFMKKYLIGSGP